MHFKSGFVVAIFTILSRISGFFRELFLASTFGTSRIADCVNVALKLPNLFRGIFAEGALLSVFIPMLNDEIAVGNENAKQFAGNVIICFLIILSSICIILEFNMPYIIHVIAPGFISDKEKFDLVVFLSRITCPYLVLVSLVTILGGILNCLNKFIFLAFSPVILNICIILTFILLSGKNILHYYICYTVLFAGTIQILFMYYVLLRFHFKVRLNLNIDFLKIKKMLIKMMPAALNFGSYQVNSIVIQSICSFIPGVVSSFAYAERIYQLPLSIIGNSLSVVLLPSLSNLYKKNDKNAFVIQEKAILVAIILSIPTAIFISILSKPIISLVFERGVFSSTDVMRTSFVLSISILTLPVFVLIKIVFTIFYAKKDTETPLKITIAYICSNIILTAVLFKFFKVTGIVFASLISAWCKFGFLFYAIKKNSVNILTKKVIRVFYIILFLSLLSGLIIYIVQNLFFDLSTQNFMQKISHIMISGISGLTVLLIGMYFFNILNFVKLSRRI